MTATELSTQDDLLNTVAQGLLLWAVLGRGTDPAIEQATEDALRAVAVLLRTVRTKRFIGGTADDTLGQ